MVVMNLTGFLIKVTDLFQSREKFKNSSNSRTTGCWCTGTRNLNKYSFALDSIKFYCYTTLRKTNRSWYYLLFDISLLVLTQAYTVQIRSSLKGQWNSKLPPVFCPKSYFRKKLFLLYFRECLLPCIPIFGLAYLPFLHPQRLKVLFNQITSYFQH